MKEELIQIGGSYLAKLKGEQREVIVLERVVVSPPRVAGTDFKISYTKPVVRFRVRFRGEEDPSEKFFTAQSLTLKSR
jgi:hypothetical protein